LSIVVILVFLFIQYVLVFKKFNPNKSFLKILSISPIGVITIKNIISIIIGDITLPSVSPNFIQSKLKGFSNCGFVNDNANRKIDNTNGKVLIELPFKIGQKENNKKINEKTSPKVFSEDLFISFFL
jgi:hypothetical protein